MIASPPTERTSPSYETIMPTVEQAEDSRLADQDAALGELPTFVADASAKQELAGIIDKNYADVGTIPVFVYQIVAHGNR